MMFERIKQNCKGVYGNDIELLEKFNLTKPTLEQHMTNLQPATFDEVELGDTAFIVMQVSNTNLYGMVITVVSRKTEGQKIGGKYFSIVELTSEESEYYKQSKFWKIK